MDLIITQVKHFTIELLHDKQKLRNVSFSVLGIKNLEDATQQCVTLPPDLITL